MQLWAIILDSFREARDRRIFWVLVLITLCVALAMASVSFGGTKVSILFGLWEVDTERFSPLTVLGRSRVAGIVVYGLLNLFLGRLGITLMIIATAGAFPAMMEKGAIDVLLGKPISRTRLFLYKYLSGMTFVVIQATLFVGLTFLVVGWRWGVWVPGYFVSIPLLVLLFSYIYCVSVLVAVIMRSTIAAILLSIASWVVFGLVQQAPGFFEQFPELQTHATAYRAVRVVSWIPPKTGDIIYLAARCANAGTSLDSVPPSVLSSETDEDRQAIQRGQDWEETQLELSPLYSIGSSLLFEAVIVLIALRKFSRADF
jgi:ABC-type transport system involved in multi-copper enzyme maturation permease subunit